MKRSVGLLIFLAMIATSRAIAESSTAACADFGNDPSCILYLDPRGHPWYKGQLHAHSLWGRAGNGLPDSAEFPEMIALWYRDHCYNFLVLTEHNSVPLDLPNSPTLSSPGYWVPNTGLICPDGGSELEPTSRFRERVGPIWYENVACRTVGLPNCPDPPGVECVHVKPLDRVAPGPNGAPKCDVGLFTGLQVSCEGLRTCIERAGQFILLPGEEITEFADSGASDLLHVNAINIRRPLLPLSGSLPARISGLVDAIAARSKVTLAIVNHPNLDSFAISPEQLAASSAVFFEVFNGSNGTHNDGAADQGHGPRLSTDRIWDIANTLRISTGRRPLYGVAADDVHELSGGSQGDLRTGPGRGWVVVRAERLRPKSLIRALRKGDFYASTGVVLRDLRYSPRHGLLQLQIDGEPGEVFTTRFLGTRAGYDPNDPDTIGLVLDEDVGTSPSYQLAGDELYVRAVVTSSKVSDVPLFCGCDGVYRPGCDGCDGTPLRRAWTQPFGWKRRVK